MYFRKYVRCLFKKYGYFDDLGELIELLNKSELKKFRQLELKSKMIWDETGRGYKPIQK